MSVTSRIDNKLLRKSRALQSGDTLIEVLFAFAVLSLVIIGALSLMNQGTLASERSLETTIVRQQIDGQATTLRFLHDAYVANYQPGVTPAAGTPAAEWTNMTSQLTATAASSISNLTSCSSTFPPGSFILDPTTATFQGIGAKLSHSVTYAQLVYNASGVLSAAQGIWIEGIQSGIETDVNKKNTRYIDFHIDACWDAPGQGPPMTIATIVRLYEPRS